MQLQAVAAMTPLVRESRSGIAAPNFVAFAQRFLLGEEEGQSLLPGVGSGGLLYIVHLILNTSLLRLYGVKTLAQYRRFD